MQPAAAIGKLGFRRWYERQLLQGHAWLVASLLCAFALLALIGDFSFRDAAGPGLVAMIAAAAAAGWIAWYALARYLQTIMQAQHLAERSTCQGCGTYGRYRLVGASSRSMTVCCAKCGNEWTIS